ncbi:MAG: UPF0175 family protein, partial [Anaerolineales bacterium]
TDDVRGLQDGQFAPERWAGLHQADVLMHGTIGRAAQLAGVTRVEFLLALGRYQVSPFALDVETLAEDIANA